MSEDEFSLVQGEKAVFSAKRGLVGWMNDNAAINFLLGRQPSPTDGITQFQRVINECRSAVEARPSWKPTDPIRAIDQRIADALKARSDLQANFAQFQWSPAMVDLREVLSYQPAITLDGLGDRVSLANDDLDELVKFCLPISEPVNTLGGIVDPDQKGFTISSLNPNLRIFQGVMHDTEVPPGPGLPPIRVKAVTFFIGMGSSYLHVAR